MPVKEVEVKAQDGAKVIDFHYMKRTIGPELKPDGTITGDMLDAQVKAWLERGYDLFSSHYVGTMQGGSDQFVFIFVKREAA